jgi:hypothetical protein
MRAAQKLLGALTIGGGLSGHGVVVEEVKGVKYAPMPPKIYKNGKKKGGFPHFLAYNSPKSAIFCAKELYKIYSRYIF